MLDFFDILHFFRRRVFNTRFWKSPLCDVMKDTNIALLPLLVQPSESVSQPFLSHSKHMGGPTTTFKPIARSLQWEAANRGLNTAFSENLSSIWDSSLQNA